MSAGFWGDTNQEFRPGCGFDNYPGVSGATINARIPVFFSEANRALWFKEGTYGSVHVRIFWKSFYVNQNVAPTGDASDPSNPAYNWSALDNYVAMTNLSLLGGNPLFLQLWNTRTDGVPQWMINAGLTRTNTIGPMISWANPTARAAWDDFITALSTRYAATRKWWALHWAELLDSNGSAEQLGYAASLNHAHDAFGGRVTVFIPGNALIYSTLVNATYPTVGMYYPDPKFFASGCTPTCNPTSARGRMQAQFQNRPMAESTENNGLYPVFWPNIDNPFGNNSTTQAHVPTAKELAWYFSSEGVVPVHCLIWVPTEWGYSVPTLTLAEVYAANDEYMAGGTTAQGDTLPALPTNYNTDPPACGSPTLATIHIADSKYAANDAGGTGRTIAKPSNLADGDWLLWELKTGDSAASSGSNFSNVDPSFSLVVSHRSLLSSFVPEVSLYLKKVTSAAGEPSTYSFDCSMPSLAAIHRISGCHETSPIGATIRAENSGTTGVTTLTTASISTTDDNSLIFTSAAFRNNSPSNIDIAGATKLYEQNPSGQPRDSAAFYYEVAAQGAADAQVLTWTTTTRAAAVSIEILGKITEAGDVTAPTLHASSAITKYAGTQTSLDLLWNDATDDTAVIDYIVERSPDGSTDWQVIATVTQAQKTASEGANSYSYRDSNLVAASSYYYRYRARDAVPNTSAYSTVSAQLTTDTPADNTAPTYAGASGASINSETGDITLTHTQATDNVTSSANMRYLIYASTGTIDYDSPVYGPLSNPGVGLDSLLIPAGVLQPGTYNIGSRAQDEAGNIDANTVTHSVIVPAPSGFYIEPCDNGTGSQKTGDVYLHYALKGQPLVVDSDNPQNTGVLISLAGDGTDFVPAAPGDYRWHLVDPTDPDDVWEAKGTATAS